MSEGLASLLLPAMIIILLGFMFWSQRRRQNAVATLQSSLAVGDDILTTSGLFGRITALDEVTATLQVAPGTQVRFDRRAIATKVDTDGRPLGDAGRAAPDVSAQPPRDTGPTSDSPRTDTEK